MSSFTETKIKGDVVRIAGQYGTFITGDLFINNQQVSPGSMDLADGSVTTSKLANFAVTGIKLAPNSVDPTKIWDNAITTSKILNSAVNSDKLANNSVMTSKILDTNVTLDKIETIGSAHIIVGNTNGYPKSVNMSGDATIAANGYVTVSASLANNSVGTAQLINNAVITGKLATALQPSHVVKYAGRIINTTAGNGSALPHSFTINGVLGTDFVFTQMYYAGTATTKILAAMTGTDSLIITFDGTEAVGDTFYYQVLRAV